MEDSIGPGDHDTNRQESPRQLQKVVRAARGGAGKEDNADWLAISWGQACACKERSQEGMGATRCEGKALSSAASEMFS